MKRPLKRVEQDSRSAFRSALVEALKTHRDSERSLLRAIGRANRNDAALLHCWITGLSTPEKDRSFRLLLKIERHYGLSNGHFRSILRKPSARQQLLRSVCSFDRELLSWHLPEDFDSRTEVQQREIIVWLQRSVLKGSTDYGRFLGRIIKHRYSVLFPDILKSRGYRSKNRRQQNSAIGKTIIAPDQLKSEMLDLVRFQTAILSPLHYRRASHWKPSTMTTNVRIFGQLFGALAAPSDAPICGRGVPVSSLTFGLVVFPSVLDWFCRWRHLRRGFFSVAERNLLYLVVALTRKESGWVRQNPMLANSLKVIPGLVSRRDIAEAKQDWHAACERSLSFSQSRSKEFCRVVRQHRDPFEAILPILKSASPLLEYKKIVDEIERELDKPASSRIEFARTVRAFLLLRVALHLGVRQRNLRELLICKQGEKPLTANKLEALQRGEMRWDSACQCWEVFIPAAAFKNSRSSFFKGRPFHLTLPDIGKLYELIDDYLARWRPVLLKGSAEPRTFFVRTAVRKGVSAEYDVNGLYDEWKWIVQKYGIFNPFTKRGAIEGLLPHGPHCIRDVLATHILRQTGSYELAGFAIQDTPASVMEHYARFLPTEKSAHAAKILNEVWLADLNKESLARVNRKALRAMP